MLVSECLTSGGGSGGGVGGRTRKRAHMEVPKPFEIAKRPAQPVDLPFERVTRVRELWAAIRLPSTPLPLLLDALQRILQDLGSKGQTLRCSLGHY